MWEALKNAFIGVKEALGIEIPELPVDLGTLGETATTAVQGVADIATSAVDDAAATVVGGSDSVVDAISGLPLDGPLPK